MSCDAMPVRSLAGSRFATHGAGRLHVELGIEWGILGRRDVVAAIGGKAKRSLAIREYALSLEALHRFVEKEPPLYRVHECVFGVLAFESEPVDPRL